MGFKRSIKRARESLRRRIPFAFPGFYARVPGSKHKLADLVLVDYLYERMYQDHAALHERLIDSLDAASNRTVLEIACGTGFTIQHFRDKKLNYFGCDISETALSVAMLKFPEERYFNLSVADLKLLADDSFDIVYNSSMLEHIGFYEHAIQQMVRVARREVYIMFFEGLFERDENESTFHPFTEAQISGSLKDSYGRKIVLQDHLVHDQKGWYMNRYSRKVISAFVAGLGHEFTIMDRTNTDYIGKEAVLVIRKA